MRLLNFASMVCQQAQRFRQDIATAWNLPSAINSAFRRMRFEATARLLHPAAYAGLVAAIGIAEAPLQINLFAGHDAITHRHG